MVIVDHVIRDIREEDLRGKELDTLLLTSEQRRWVRGRFTTSHGREIAIALPTGTVLHAGAVVRSEEHTSELQSPCNLVCRLLLEKKKRSEKRPHTIFPTNRLPQSIYALCLPTAHL